MKTILTLAAAASTLASGLAAAAPLTFFGEDGGLGETTALSAHPNADAARDDFFASLSGTNNATQSFETFTPSTDLVAGALTVDFGALGSAVLNEGFISEEPFGGRYAISGKKFWETSTTSFTVHFSSAVIGFGFYGIDVGDYGGQMTISLSNGSTSTVGHALNAVGGAVLYWGFLDRDNPFTSITFGNTNAGSDWFGFDDFSIVTAMPDNPVSEPGILALFGIGFVALCLGRRRINVQE